MLLLGIWAVLFAPGSLEAAGEPGPTDLAAAVLAPTGQPQDVGWAVRAPDQPSGLTIGALAAVAVAVVVALALRSPSWRLAAANRCTRALRPRPVGVRRRGPPAPLV